MNTIKRMKSYIARTSYELKQETAQLAKKDREYLLFVGVEQIALNDNAGEDEDIRTTATYPTVGLLADMFNMEPIEVARRVVRARRKRYRGP